MRDLRAQLRGACPLTLRRPPIAPIQKRHKLLCESGQPYLPGWGKWMRRWRRPLDGTFSPWVGAQRSPSSFSCQLNSCCLANPSYMPQFFNLRPLATPYSCGNRDPRWAMDGVATHLETIQVRRVKSDPASGQRRKSHYQLSEDPSQGITDCQTRPVAVTRRR